MPLTSSFLPSIGDTYKDFKVTRIVPITELQCTLKELIHEPTGACVMHIDTSDPENLFCISLKTLPSSSNGAAHILEHTVLCGSKKFPVKDPFFAMTRRSLNTFMNAMTGSDFTCYPAASLVEKDFYNLLDVYLDAVFHPKLLEMSFLQEGHRLEFEKAEDPTTPLEIKGIVFNEMKGSLSAPESRLWHEMLKILVPDLPYAFNSGGDPEDIPKLSYQELLDFHKTYYVPSRALFFFYGNLPLQKHLDFIEENTLKKAAKEAPLPLLPKQKRFDSPKTVLAKYPVAEGSQDTTTMIAFGFLTAPIQDQEEILALSVLDSILMDTDGSLLKLPLLASGLCVQAEAYMDTEMTEVPYVLLFKGCKPEHSAALEALVRKTLESIIEKGIPDHLIDAAIHQMELSRTEITTDHGPFGLTLFMRSALAKQHGCTPEYALMIHSLFEKLIAKVKNPSYFPELIRKFFLNNTHLVRLVMAPDPNLAAEELALEKKVLEHKKASLTSQEIEKIVHTAKELKIYQERIEHQDVECLPKVSLSDVPRLTRDFKLNSTECAGVKVYHLPTFTNHILYVDLVFELPDLALSDLPYVHLLAALIPELGCGTRSYTENLEALHAHTGGIGASCSLFSHVDDPNRIKPAIILKGKALERKGDKLLPLMIDIASSCRFDEKKRIEELLLQIHSSLQNRLNKNAMRYASQLALSELSQAAHLSNLWYGLPYFHFINELKKELSSGLDNLIQKLQTLYNKLFSASSSHLILACEEKPFIALEEKGFCGLDQLPNKEQSAWSSTLPLKDLEGQARIIASQVAFNAEAFTTVAYGHPDSAALLIASQLLENKVLHAKVREQGGAYGSGAQYGAMTGTFSFHSYRDPHIASTFEAFSDSLKVLAEGDFSDKELEEAKLGIIQGIDAPLSPMAKAMIAFTWAEEGKTLSVRQAYRDKILSCDAKEIAHAVQTHLLEKEKSAIRVSFAGKPLLEKENPELRKARKELAVYPL